VSPATTSLRTVDAREWSMVRPTLPFAVIDVETTGLSPTVDRIIEIAVVQCDPDGTVTAEWSALVDPGRDPGPTHIHGITASDLVGAPAFATVVPAIVERLDGRMVVAHNISFDASFLANEFSRASATAPERPAVCTLELARAVLPPMRGYSLAACAKALGIEHPDAHRALPDTRVTAAVLRAMLQRLHGASEQDSLPFG
jgi:DNA polymerase III epsilon subunit family exonuclease